MDKEMNFRQKVLASLMAALLFIGMILATSSAFADTQRTAVVVEVNEEEDTVLFFDGAGLFWVWEGAEDFCVFDVASFELVDVEGTESILDDEMSQPVYSGIRVDKEWLVRWVSDVDPQLAMDLALSE